MNRRFTVSTLHRARWLTAALAVALLLCHLGIAAPAEAQSVADAQITEQVTAALGQIDKEQARRLHVSTEDGVVTLTGTVSPGLALKALNAAKGVQGVTKVRNRMTVTQ
jgi:osmotically-inducible protein OsmY